MPVNTKVTKRLIGIKYNNFGVLKKSKSINQRGHKGNAQRSQR